MLERVCQNQLLLSSYPFVGQGKRADKKWGLKLSMIEWSGLLALHLKMILPDLKKIILKVRGWVR